MRALKKILSLCSAAVIAAACVMQVSAETFYMEDLVYYRDYNDNVSDAGFFIDNTGRCGVLESGLYGIVVRMKDGAVPVLKNSNYVMEKTTEEGYDTFVGSLRGTSFELDGEFTDNSYYIHSINLLNETTDAQKAYCRELAKSDDVVSAGLLYMTSYCNSTPYMITLKFENKTAAESFKLEDIEGYSEYFVEMDHEKPENEIHISFNSLESFAEGAKVLCLLEKCSEIKELTISFISDEASAGWYFNIYSAFESGDVNLDEKTDLYDAIDIAKYIMNLKSFNNEQKALGDLNKDSSVDLYDAIEIAKQIM